MKFKVSVLLWFAGPADPDHPAAAGYSHGSWTQAAC